MPQTNVTSNHPIDKVMTVGWKDIEPVNAPKWVFSFRPIGEKNMRKPDSLDALGFICKFTKGELFLLEIVKNRTKGDNTITVKTSSFSSGEKQKVATAIRSWIKKGLIKRIIKENYMINPHFIVPPKKFQEPALDQWNSLP